MEQFLHMVGIKLVFLKLLSMIWLEGIEKCSIQISLSYSYKIPFLEILFKTIIF